MPTETKQQVSADSIKKQLDTVEEGIKKFVGKKGMNPFLWIAKKIKPLRDRLSKGEATQELLNAAMALKVEEPTVTKHVVEQKPDVQSNVPSGLKLPTPEVKK